MTNFDPRYQQPPPQQRPQPYYPPQQQWQQPPPPYWGPPPPPNNQTRNLVAGGVIAALVFGLILNLQSASLLTGTGTQWMGAGLCVAAAIMAWAASKMTWLKVLATGLAIVTIANGIYLEKQLDDLRSSILNG